MAMHKLLFFNACFFPQTKTMPELGITSTRQYAHNLFLNSLITGVSQILETRSVARKLVKSAVLLACLIGFIYQTSGFLNIFWSYPTVLDIKVEYPEIIESPAITFCNLNGIKRTPFCKEHPNMCGRPKDSSKFCRAFPRFCGASENKNIKLPEGEGLSFEENISLKDLKILGHDSNDTLLHCQTIQSSDQQSTDWIPCSSNVIHTSVSDGKSLRNCYTLFSNINSAVLNRYILPVPKKKDALFHMVFNMEGNEYFRPDREVGIMIAVHSPNSIVNPFFDGFVIKPKNLYTLHLKVVEEKLLPFPYETRCQDYKSIWIQRGKKGSLSQEMCLAECMYNASITQCSCVIPNILYPHTDRVCTEEEMDCFDFNITKCYDVCQQPCNFKDFEYDVQERTLENPGATDIEDFYEDSFLIKDKAALLVFLKRPEIIVYSHRPQYEDIEVFSFIGGYMGMWLGVSLVAVFDFLESVTRLANFWIRKKWLQNSNKTDIPLE